MQSVSTNEKNDLTKRCYRFSLNVINLADSLPQKRSSWIIADQLVRSATSIGANIVEGKASSSRLEFKKFYEIALRSANESKYWLAMLRDTKLAQAKQTEELLNEATEIANMLASGVMKLKRQ